MPKLAVLLVSKALWQNVPVVFYAHKTIHANPRNLKSRRHFYMSRPLFFLDFIHLFNTITLHHGQELPTLLTILIVGVKSGRFRYQSRRAGDEAKKRKSPAKSRRVDISVKPFLT